ncbi:HNH endonuclease [Okeania sp. SIO2G5]|uniref:HNH endonuclease n=1 Tax=Okeania sp. SIO2G5 TaxID=2607796 RepID=UPI00338DB3D6
MLMVVVACSCSSRRIQHILVAQFQPVSKGGFDSEENLCLACELCNQYKWTQTEGIDPQTQTAVSS